MFKINQSKIEIKTQKEILWSKINYMRLVTSLKKYFYTLLGLMISKSAFADASESPVGEGLSYFINAVVYGTDGVVIATIAVAGVGIACLKHRIEWVYFFYTVAGIAIVFGAPAIVQGIKSLVHTA